MSTNDPSEPSPFEPPRPGEHTPLPAPPGAPVPLGEEPGDAAALAAEEAPTAQEVAPTTREAVLAAEEATPVTEEVTSVTEDVTPVTEDVTPVTEDVTPVTEEVIAPAEAIAPATAVATEPRDEPTTVVPVTTAAAVAPPRKGGGVRVLSILVLISGVILMAAGAFTWYVVRDQLSDEKITVSDDADYFAGDPVDNPWTAYEQADVINKDALEASGGLTYAQLPQDDPKRNTVMTASFLRASLYTSVVSFGVAAFAFGIGVVLILISWALWRLDRRLRWV